MSSTTIPIQCAKCGQKFRIAPSDGPVHLTCPKCAAQWDWQESIPPERLGGKMSGFWRGAVLVPRLSYAGSAGVLLAGVGLGLALGYHQAAPPADDLSFPPALTDSPPPVHSSAQFSKPAPAAAIQIDAVESLLPSNGVDFNSSSPIQTNL
jgi:hypothetical protein